MTHFRRFAIRLVDCLRLVRGRRRLSEDDLEVEDELRFHLDKLSERNEARGMPPAAARRAALVTFGGVAQVTEAARDELRSRPLDDFVRDVKYGLRALGRSPGFAAAAVTTLALGIAATVTVFSFVDTIYLRPLDVPTGSRLVRINVNRGRRVDDLGFGGFKLILERATTLDRVFAHYSTAPLHVRVGDQSGEVQGAVVSASYFPALGIQPALGRFFTANEDEVPDRDFVAVIGYGMWQKWFGSDPHVIGRSMSINGRTFAIVGVGPERFAGVVPSTVVDEMWIPMMTIHVGYRWCDGFARDCAIFDVMGRLAPRATLAAAEAEIQGLSSRLIAVAEPSDSTGHAVVVPALGVREQSRRSMDGLSRLLSAIGLTLLLIACANLAGLLLARGLAREREVAVRISLGAGRWRIVRQMLAESFVIAAAGGVLGLAVSIWAARLLVGFYAVDNEGYVHAYDSSLNARVLAFALVLSLATTFIFGLFPAIEATRPDHAARLRRAGASVGARARLALVGAQTALSLVLLIGAALLVRSVDRIASGGNLDPRNVALLRLRPRLVGYDAARSQEFLHRVLTRIAAMPEVEDVAIARGIGLVWASTGTRRFSVPGDGAISPDRQPDVDYHEISPRFFATLRIPIVRGREFTDRDDMNAPAVAIVNETLARRISSDGSAIGRTISLDDKHLQVVGVVRDYRVHNAGESEQPMAFVPFWQNLFGPQFDARAAIRVRGDPAQSYLALRRAIAEVDPAVPVTETLPLATQIAGSYVDVRLGRAVLMLAGALALFLSAIGLHGVVAFLVEKRAREIGLRLAVGARPRSVVALLASQGLVPIAGGVLAGLLVAFAGARLLSSWLYGVSPTDTTAFAVAAMATVLVATVASCVPALRAASIDPIVALRAD